MTDVIKTIGATNSPTVPDYATLSLWEADIPADLVAVDERHIGECLDQGTFTVGVTISGQTTDATRNIILRCAAGASFADKAGVRTNPLAYNNAGGVSLEISTSSTLFTFGTPNTQVRGLQIKRTGNSYGLLINTGLCRFDDCIIDGSNRTDNTGLNLNFTTLTFANCLFVVDTATTNSQVEMYGCTWVNNSGGAASGTAITSRYNNALLKNCAVFGFSTAISGTTRAGSDYNATDAASIGGTGSNNLVGLTFADQFESTTIDFRAVSTGDLQAGTPDATNTPDDISGLTRNVTTPWIGCWEVEVGGGGSPVSATLQSLWHQRALASLAYQLLWNDSSAINDANQLNWSVRKTVTESAQSIWGTRGLASKSTQSVWDTLAAVEESSQTTWDVLQSLNKQNSLLWNTLLLAGNSQQSIWDCRATAASELDFLWNVLVIAGTATQSVQLLWNDYALASNNPQLTWNVSQSVSQASETPWAIRQLASQQTQSPWSVRAAATQSSYSIWDVRSLISQQTQIPWNVSLGVNNPLELKWGTRISAGQGSQFLYRVLAQANGHAALVWDARSLSTSSLSTPWNVLGLAFTADLELKWSARELAIQELEQVWNVRAEASLSRQFLWDVLLNVEVVQIYEFALYLKTLQESTFYLKRTLRK